MKAAVLLENALEFFSKAVYNLEMLNRAAHLKDNGKYDEAIEVLLQHLKVDNLCAKSFCHLAHCYILKKSFIKARVALAKAKELDPNLAAIGWNEARLLTLEKKIIEALKVAKKTNEKHPDDVEGYVVLGACLRINGNLIESLHFLDLAISRHTRYAEAYLNRGLISMTQGDAKRALSDFLKAHSIKPYNEQVWDLIISLQIKEQDYSGAITFLNNKLELSDSNEKLFLNLAVCYRQLGDLDASIKSCRSAISIKSDFAEAYLNMGVALQEQGRADEAIKASLKAISIKPEIYEAHLVIGTSLQIHGKLEEALKTFYDALSIKPDVPEAYYNIGNCLKEQGKLRLSLESYHKALALNPNYSLALQELSYLITQLPDDAPLISEFQTLALQHKIDMSKMPRFQIQKAINAFVLGEYDLVSLHLSNYEVQLSKLTRKMARLDEIFCSAYQVFLRKLTQSSAALGSNSQSLVNVYHLGESHCLSYANQILSMRGEKYKITPRITFGAKAFHFSVNKDNQFKAICKFNFESLPNYSNVFLSFGEIDCRANEGFIIAEQKLTKHISILVRETVESYVGWFAELNKQKKHRLFFFNVPAPIFNKKTTMELNFKVAGTIAKFNAALAKYATLHNFNVIDVYSFTCGENGFSNKKYHIDGYHLGPHAIEVIEPQLN